MPSESPFPATYADWRVCIEQRCRQPLTPTFIAARFAALRDPADAHTRDFARLYGPAHLSAVTGWFEHAATETRAG
jgi:hypothetical protein